MQKGVSQTARSPLPHSACSLDLFSCIHQEGKPSWRTSRSFSSSLFLFLLLCLLSLTCFRDFRPLPCSFHVSLFLPLPSLSLSGHMGLLWGGEASSESMVWGLERVLSPHYVLGAQHPPQLTPMLIC